MATKSKTGSKTSGKNPEQGYGSEFPEGDWYFTPPKKEAAAAHVKSFAEYEKINKAALADPEKYWGDRAKELLHWYKPWEKTLDYDFSDPRVNWFVGGKTNASYNCLDRHINGPRRNKVALIWQGEPEHEYRVWTYQMLYDRVCRFASALKNNGVRKGDRVVLYLPMIPETVVAMLACARIGAIHVMVFAGFSSSSVQMRIQDCEARIVITADAVLRAGRVLPLKSNLDEALKDCPSVRRVIVVNRANTSTTMRERRDVWWRDIMADKSLNACLPAVEMPAEDPLFLLYTSGSTGKPKGVMHSIGGYCTYAAHTMQYVFDHKDRDVHWCTADVGWITGHTYLVYGPLLLGGTTVMYEGGPLWPDPDRFWQIVEQYRVNTFYTAPTAIRTLIREGVEWLDGWDLSSLRILGSVGEPIGADTWKWYHDNVGGGKIPVVDTWWQTESGGIMIAPLPYATPTIPGSATLPLPGIQADIVNSEGESIQSADEEGHLVVKYPWPGMFSGIYKDKEKYKSAYFERFPGMYLTGDGAKKDEHGYFWLTGRLDDVINVSGHRFSTAEMEAAFMAHKDVAEAVVVGMPHALKGEAIYAFIRLNFGEKPSEQMRADLRKWLRKEIGPIATPEYVQFVDGLPKTRSGKVMRRILRKVVSGEFADIGDTTTLAEPEIVPVLIEEAKRLTGMK